MSYDHDLAVVGSGFGGSLIALIARRLGLRVWLVERDTHPRFVIGESSTPLANLIWEDLCARYDLPAVRSLSKFGTWQKAHSNLACGLKRGFSFFHHVAGQPWPPPGTVKPYWLVAASPRDAIADTHWYRPDLDQFLAYQARSLGAELWESTDLQSIRPHPRGVELAGRHGGNRFSKTVRWVIDATGPRGFVSRALAIPEMSFAGTPATQTLYGHFTGVKRWEDLFPSPAESPFAMDDAAVHHVFEGGWMWVLRFNNGITSAGVALEQSLGDALRLEEGPAAWSRILRRWPSLGSQFEGATFQRPLVYGSRISFRSRHATGPGWAMLPSACGVVDPLLSTGFALNLLGIARLAAMMEETFPPRPDALQRYESDTFDDLDRSAQLIGALYACMADFELFTALTKLYFAPISFTEAAWRLGKRERTGRLFLLGEREPFARAMARCCQEAAPLRGSPSPSAARAAWLETIRETIQPYDVAGLSRPGAGPCFPARAEDLLAEAVKLGASEQEIRDMLARTGMLEAVPRDPLAP